MVYVLGLLPRTVHLGFQKCIARKKNDNYIIICADRAGPDSVGQGWVLGSGHWALQGCERPGKAAQNRSGQFRKVPDSVGRGQIRRGGGTIRVGQYRTALGKNWDGQHSAEPDKGGKGSVRQYRGMKDRVDTYRLGGP